MSTKTPKNPSIPHPLLCHSRLDPESRNKSPSAAGGLHPCVILYVFHGVFRQPPQKIISVKIREIRGFFPIHELFTLQFLCKKVVKSMSKAARFCNKTVQKWSKRALLCAFLDVFLRFNNIQNPFLPP
jgi:hypothetical protein